MKAVDFGNAAIPRWLTYFSEYDELDLATLLILDITRLGGKGTMDREPAPWLISGGR